MFIIVYVYMYLPTLHITQLYC